MPSLSATTAHVSSVLAVGGSDPSGGAGIQADLKTLQDLKVYGMGAITAVTVQNTQQVLAVEPVDPKVLQAQVLAVLDDITPTAIKIGMLVSQDHVEALATSLEGFGGFVVLDPVLVSSSGHPLIDAAGLDALRTLLLPRATLVTPNLNELGPLLGGASPQAALFGSDTALLIKGGHGEADTLVDELRCPDGSTHRWTHPRRASRNTHGTGCTLASAIAAHLSLGRPLLDAVDTSIAYLQALIAGSASHEIGHGTGPLLHGLLNE